MEQPYKTISQTASDTYVTKKSRFIGNVSPAADEHDALENIRLIKETYRDASHHCFAYIIGQNASISRYSDAGEPSGTAGIPILEAIKSRDIVNCCVVVTRYFGGVLLGTGGLARAYSHSTSLALKAADIVVMHPCVRYRLEIAYPFWDKAVHLLQLYSAQIINTEFSDRIRTTLLVRQSNYQMLISKLRLLTSNRMILEALEETYAPWPEP